MINNIFKIISTATRFAQGGSHSQKYFSAEKSFDPTSRRRAPVLRRSPWSRLTATRVAYIVTAKVGRDDDFNVHFVHLKSIAC
ncbi:MAG: hypothetical protein A2648_02215 [Candidatus Lloydbacteria bacterium RIFCSPHIGHO2_01_FULL_41_20]|uniref:Uncharacterized protein n=1 Tax=Candidatus Lloydbacteria bacterium RIFCSPHIGHO2_01_FULL_41_20 TaxID=1798657 RepID=A0A1G2CR69_9BACT|nr:MAG: hypothetical protein A2648_02215 [Candidatus Lloydbacteria bacterium RIFCSPHIGHO2_01_FULL_41_20]